MLSMLNSPDNYRDDAVQECSKGAPSERHNESSIRELLLVTQKTFSNFKSSPESPFRGLG